MIDRYTLVTGSGDNSIRVWDLRKKTKLNSLVVPGHMNMVSDVRFALSDAKEFLVSASYDKTCRIWSARDFAPIKTLRGHEDKVSSVDVSSGIDFATICY